MPINNRIDLRFLEYWFRLPGTLAKVNEDCSGSTPLTRNRFKENFFLDLEIPLPPLDEQRRIIRRIDELATMIEEAKGLQRENNLEGMAIIISARNQIYSNLARTLNPVRLDTLADSRLGKMLNPSAKTGVGSAPYLRNANVQWNHFDLDEVFDMDFSDEEKRELVLQKGDILVSKVETSAKLLFGITKFLDVVSKRHFIEFELMRANY